MKTELESILSQPVCGGSTAKGAHRIKAAVVDQHDQNAEGALGCRRSMSGGNFVSGSFAPYVVNATSCKSGIGRSSLEREALRSDIFTPLPFLWN